MKMLARLFLATLLSAAMASAQQAAPTGQPPASRSIRLNVTVTDKSGAPVTGLSQQDFTLLDNKTVSPITSFKAIGKGQEPARVILLFDAVNAPFTVLTDERNQVAKFLLANDGHLTHPTTIGLLSDTGARVESGFSSDGKQVNDALDRMESGLRQINNTAGIEGANERRQTSLNAFNHLGAYAATIPGRKIVIWISPGWPILSGIGEQLDDRLQRLTFQHIIEFSNQLRQANLTSYDINPLGAEAPPDTYRYHESLKGVSKPGQTDFGDLALQVLSVQSGGLSIEGNSDIPAMLQKCYADTESWYEITFDPPPERPNEYHHLEIKLDKPGLTARTRDGYYTQP